jgi:glutamate-1-semialdehyde 2,1-aminomutase
MELGGLGTDRSRVFLLSTTHGAETTGLAAYVAVAEADGTRLVTDDDLMVAVAAGIATALGDLES